LSGGLLLATHAASTWALVGLIWTIHVVHYPLFASLVVGPLMLVELLTAITLWLSPPAGIDGRVWIVGLALLGLVWLETALFAVPQHGRLEQGFDESTHRALMAGNLVRTLAWTARGVLVGWVMVRLLDGEAMA